MDLQQRDWSKAYRLYSKHIDQDSLFEPVLDGAAAFLSGNEALVVAIDDSHRGKTGEHIPGVGWHRDPLGPQFHTNLARLFRFIQISAAIRDPDHPGQARMVPIAFGMIPKLKKPGKDASEKEKAEFEEIRKANSPGAHAARLLQRLRQSLNAMPGHENRTVWVCGDGAYSNCTTLQNLPPNTVYIGRTRDDLHIHEVAPPAPKGKRGRKPEYGQKLPTPGEIRKDKSIPWKTITVEKSGKETTVRYKNITRVKWRKAASKSVVQIVVIAPLRYRKRKNGPYRYTKPAYLICTNSRVPVGQLIQAYFWRWGIEVNFREEKQIMGTGQAQVRNSASVSTAPAVAVATYAALLLAGIRCYGFRGKPESCEPPKWYRKKKEKMRMTTSDLINELKNKSLIRLSGNFSDFAPQHPPNTNSKKFKTPNSPIPSQYIA
jgi:hypothetical protein